jgi:hypothetical protein
MTGIATMADDELGTLVTDLVKKAEARHRENSVTYYNALQQIVAVCTDNDGETCRHDLALAFVKRIALRALPSR